MTNIAMSLQPREVTASPEVSAAQLAQFFKLIDQGSIHAENLQSFIESPNRFSMSGCRISLAQDILGRDHVVKIGKMTKIWNYPYFSQVQVPYTEETIKQCAHENATQGTNWVLLYILPLSFTAQLTILKDRFYHPITDEWNLWWDNPAEKEWQLSTPAKGYQLLDLNPRFYNLDWKTQEELLKEDGSIVRADDRCISQAFATALILGMKLFSWATHYGTTQDYLHIADLRTSRVTVGITPNNNVSISSSTIEFHASWLGVCAAKKPDF